MLRECRYAATTRINIGEELTFSCSAVTGLFLFFTRAAKREQNRRGGRKEGTESVQGGRARRKRGA